MALNEIATIRKGKKPGSLVSDSVAAKPYLTADVLRGGGCTQFVPNVQAKDCVELNGTEVVVLWDGAGAGDIFPSQEGILASTMAAVEVIAPELLLPKFLQLVVAGQTQILKSTCRGTTVPHVAPEVLRQLEIPIPHYRIQERIVDFMASVDTYIEGLEKQAKAARTARSAVLQELLTAGGDNWKKTRLGDVVEFLRNRVDPLALDPEQVLRHWSIPALDETGGPLDEKAREIGSHKFQVRENAVVFSLLNPRIPRFALVIGGDNVVCSTEFAVMKPGTRMLEEFLLVVASSAIFHEKVNSLVSGTTKSRERVKASDLENSTIFLPSLEEQKRIVEIVSSMDDLIQSTLRAVVNAKSLRAGLLSDLLSGKHEIPESYDKFLGAA